MSAKIYFNSLRKHERKQHHKQQLRRKLKIIQSLFNVLHSPYYADDNDPEVAVAEDFSNDVDRIGAEIFFSE